MKLNLNVINFLLLACGLLFAAVAASTQETTKQDTTTQTTTGETETDLSILNEQENAVQDSMQFGNFSVSLTVKDIQASRDFYEKLDFKQVAGQQDQNWLVMQNGATTIGLFQGMFETNIMTFNPGWNKDKETLEEFDDVRELQRQLKERGLTLTVEADEASTGPASFVLSDPDGNVILVDQHVDKPE